MKSQGSVTRNWSQYNKKLIRNGEITLWIDPRSFSPDNQISHSGRGRPHLYADNLIKGALYLKSVYQFTFRQMQGFLRSLYHLLDVQTKAPDYTTLCRRQPSLKVSLGARSSSKARALVIDSTGLKVVGEGEWCSYKHGPHYQRTWRKVHLAVDANTLDIVSCHVSSSRTQDSQVLPKLLSNVPGQLECVIGDGAYENYKSYEHVAERQAKAVFPPRADARLSSETRYHKKPFSSEAIAQRDSAIHRIRETSRAQWKEETGYHRRSLAESTMFRLKSILGSQIKAKTEENQILEVRLRCAILNRMNIEPLNSYPSK